MPPNRLKGRFPAKEKVAALNSHTLSLYPSKALSLTGLLLRGGIINGKRGYHHRNLHHQLSVFVDAMGSGPYPLGTVRALVIKAAGSQSGPSQ